MPSSHLSRVLVEHIQCSEERQMPGPVAVVRLTAIGDTLIAARILSLLVEAGLDPVFFTYPGSVAVARLVPGLRWVAVVEKDGTFCVRNHGTQAEVKGWVPRHVLDLQCTGRSRRVVRRIGGGGVRVWRVSKRSALRLWLILRARLAGRQVVRPLAGAGRGESRFPSEAIGFRMGCLQQSMARELLASLAVALPTASPAFVAPDLSEKWGLAKRGYVVLFPGASAPLKGWGEGRFRDLLGKILLSSGLSVVVLGGPDERSVAEKICSGFALRVHDLAGKATLEESLGLIGNAAYVVTGDSFPAHACDLFEVPATVIFGATTPAFGFAPVSPAVTIRHARLSCSPCSRHGKGECRFGNLRCMELIGVDEVLGDLCRAGILATAEGSAPR